MQLYAAMRSVIGFDPKEKKKKTEYNTYNSIDKPTVRGEKKLIITLYIQHTAAYIHSVYNICTCKHCRKSKSFIHVVRTLYIHAYRINIIILYYINYIIMCPKTPDTVSRISASKDRTNARV